MFLINIFPVPIQQVSIENIEVIDAYADELLVHCSDFIKNVLDGWWFDKVESTSKESMLFYKGASWRAFFICAPTLTCPILTTLTVLYVFVGLVVADAQTNLSPSIFFNRLTTAQGLSNNTVNSLLQDRSGLLWFATDDGLNRFDGYEFKVFRHVAGNANSPADNSISTLYEDRSGKIWIGTKSGAVNCYDPTTETFQKWEIQDKTITSLYEDSQKNIWLGTYRGGLYRLNPATGAIAHWQSNPQDPFSLSNDYVTSIVEDHKRNIWIGAYHGLNKATVPVQSDTVKFTRYFSETNNPNTVSHDIVWNLTRSASDSSIIWIGTADGLTRYDSNSGAFTQIKIPNPDQLQFGASAGSVTEETSEGDRILWIDSFAGLIRCNMDQGSFARFVSNNDDPHSLAHNHISGMIKDKSGVLWLATENGLCNFPAKGTKFNNTLSAKFRFSDVKAPAKNVKAIARTDDGRIWFGAEDGLYYADQIPAGSSNKSGALNKLSASNGINIWSLAPGRSQDLWIGTYGSGLFRFDLKTNRMSAVRAYDKTITIPAIQYIKSLYCNEQKKLWIGFWGVGLARLDPVTADYQSWLHDADDPHSLSHNDVWVIFQDSRERLWVGTNGGGLNLFQEEKGGTFSHWVAGESSTSNPDRSKATATGTLCSNSIYCMCEWRNAKTSVSPDQTVLWIGTNNGLNKFVMQNAGRQFQVADISSFTGKDGLADNSVKSILEDENGHLWLGTAGGISFFNTRDNSFINYDHADGIIGGDFNYASAAQDAEGMMFMGSTSGLNYFDPRTIARSLYRPPVLITDFQIFNASVASNDPALGENKSILYANTITLSHRQNVFSFQLAALDYNSPGSSQYAYKMEGFDANWVYSGARRFITYTNLRPGSYTFKARSTNSDGIWNDQAAEIKVIITPPWWQTGWAIVLYLIIFFSSIYGIIRFQATRAKTQAMLKMQEFEFRHLQQVETMKSRFFANISHEFRTPLTLIKGPLEQLLSGRIKKNKIDYYRMLYRNAEKLQSLIDQLLELAQLEAETIPLQTEVLDLGPLLKGFVASFIPLAEQKNIDFAFRSDGTVVLALIDRDKLEKIINNLLSNAFKFTPDGGQISVELHCEQASSAMKPSTSGTAVVAIRDSGIGIPEQDRQHIFNRFFRIDDSAKNSHGGSGIGLALVKELVALHNWDISVQSQEGKGSVFTLKIPIHQRLVNHPGVEKSSSEETSFSVQDRKDVNSISPSQDSAAKIETGEGNAAASRSNNKKPVILVVEDSADVRFFLADLLYAEYTVAQAEGAKEGIALAKNTMPDLILSDIMMPGMDGIEFCQRLKTDWQTSHIPIILLTAKALPDDKIAGLETGADDYITKPFNVQELLVRIRNLIEQRRRLRDKIRQELELQPESLASNSVDAEFMHKLLSALEENLHDEKLDCELLAQKLFVSKSRLHRKLRAIAGQAPGEFIRMYKLKRAAQMIVENKFSITQIAYEVGFASPAQFTRAFKKYFSCLPSEFSRQIPSRNR